MKSDAQNPAAFPCGYRPFSILTDQSGMTLRDFFAANVIQGMYATNVSMHAHYKAEAAKLGKEPAEFLANMAYEVADAMLQARLKGQ